MLFVYVKLIIYLVTLSPNKPMNTCSRIPRQASTISKSAERLKWDAFKETNKTDIILICTDLQYQYADNLVDFDRSRKNKS